MDLRIIKGLFVFILTSSAFYACAPGIPLPPTGPHQGAAKATVPYPPPAPKPAIVRAEERPSDQAVWIDGQWEWQPGAWAWQPGAWVWQPGAWVIASPESYYAYPAFERQPNGKLLWWPGRFYRRLSQSGNRPIDLPAQSE